MNFDNAFERLIGHEGGYVDDSRDPGLETKYGISKRAYPSENIATLTMARAKQIYRPDAVRFDVFDAAVNSGPKQAAQWLQEAAGAAPDGIIGPKTLAAVRATDPHRLARRFTGARLKFMTHLRTWPSFSRGWARRIAANLLAA